MPGYVPWETDTRVCSYSFIDEKQLPAGKKLLRCSRCHETFYVSREAQKLHWPYHKISCVKIEDDEPQVRQDFGGLQQALQTAHWILDQWQQDRINGRLLLHCIQSVRKFIGETSTTPSLFRASDKVVERDLLFPLNAILDGSAGPGMSMFMSPDQLSDMFLKMVWAIPGWTNFFMSDEILLSQSMKQLKIQGLPPPPPEEYAPSGKIVVSTKYSNEDVLSLTWCDFVGRFLLSSAMHMSHGAPSSVKIDTLSLGVVRRTMEFWRCPFTRVSYPHLADHTKRDSSRHQFFYFLMRSFYTQMQHFKMYQEAPKAAYVHMHLKDDELVPGLTAKQLLQTLIQDESFFACTGTIRSMVCELVERLFEMEDVTHERGAFSSLTTEDRLELVGIGLQCKVQKSVKANGPQFPRHVKTIQHALLQLTTSTSSKHVLKLYDQVMLQDEPDEAVVKFLTTARKNIHSSKGVFDGVRTYRDVVQPKYRKRMKEAGMTAVDFPDEILRLIADYCAPKKFQLTMV